LRFFFFVLECSLLHVAHYLLKITLSGFP
jgi:hypothetical protein